MSSKSPEWLWDDYPEYNYLEAEKEILSEAASNEVHAHDASELLKILQAFKRPSQNKYLTSSHNEASFSIVSLPHLATETLPTREIIIDPIIPQRGLVMLYAARGVGKTHVGLGIAFAVATGGTFLRWKAPKPRKILYIDGEMPQQALQERARALIASNISILERPDNFQFLPMDRQELGHTINLAKIEDQKKVENLLDGVELLIIDNQSTLVNGGRENDAASWDAMQIWLLQLRRRGISVLLIHHSGRGDYARGTSKREDVLDTIIHLKRPENYEMKDGARFEVNFTKARGFSGIDAEPFEARLELVDGASTWDYSNLNADNNKAVIEMAKSGMSIREIAGRLGASKSTVQRITSTLRDRGML